ncbi:hypothetical protein OXV63_13455 [Bacteroides fragilis]|nr:hypothetical protein [Bacteroides fragilis]MCY6315933.1 hypothetical protein [Bacteroides fragilis]
MKTIIRFFLSTVAVLVTGCTPEEEHIPAQVVTALHSPRVKSRSSPVREMCR